ncbi:MAG: thioredoxin domain-containing protein [Bacilli bacterium]
MKKIIKFILFLLLIIPTSTLALSKDYNDYVGKYYNIKNDEKVNIYLFYSKICPHCQKEEKYFETLKEKYQDKINIYTYEVTENKTNNEIMKSLKKELKENSQGVPFTIIGSKTFLGYDESLNERIENTIESYLDENTKTNNTYTIPILGKIEGKNASIILIAIILGFIDGFNPCAMWILLLLINMCISIKDKKKMLIVCLTFIITSGIIYFLSMLGIGFILDLTTISYIRNIIAILAIILGIYNLYTYLKTRKQTGCHVVKKEKRKTIITKINNILNNKNTLLMFGGTIILTTSVSLVEMACSLGFPTIFLELLSINNIHSFLKVTYLLIYILFYLIDDIIVLFLSIKAFETKGISTKYNKYVHLIGGLIMILMGVLLIFKPEWIMFNF